MVYQFRLQGLIYVFLLVGNLCLHVSVVSISEWILAVCFLQENVWNKSESRNDKSQTPGL